MLFDEEIFVGIDPAGGANPFIWAAINQAGDVVALPNGKLSDAITFIRGIPQVHVAINSPRGISHSLLNDYTYRQQLNPIPNPGKYTRYRVCEYYLKIRNIRLIPTPIQTNKVPAWMKNGFELFRELDNSSDITVIETNAHASFCTLLGRIPFLKNTLEGRLQRQLILCQTGLKLRDPMDFFEEITRRKLLLGILPEGILKLPRELDALISAHVARQWKINAQESIALGDVTESQIVLPVHTLKDRYS